MKQPIAPPFAHRVVAERATIDVAAAWDGGGGATPRIQTFANLQQTLDHGSHLLGFYGAVDAALEREPALAVTPRPDFRKAARANLVVALAVDYESLDYKGPTKSKVGTPGLRGIVARALTEPLSRYFGGDGAAVARSFRSTL